MSAAPPMPLPPLPWGAELLPDGTRTRFRLWAPSAREVALEIADHPPAPMQPEPDGWFALEAAAPAGTRYRFQARLEDGSTLPVPDPAARYQPDDVHGFSQVVDPRAHAWRNTGWKGRPWHETILYELHAGTCGGYAGIRAMLPRLKALGVTAVELMPIAEFPGPRNWGYDGVLPFAPAASYGTPEELKALIDEAHGLGLMMFLDVVYNHFGPDGAYLHAYAKDFFDEGVHTPWGAAIDFRKPPVRDFFESNALYWLREYRFDGLRFDAVHAIAEQDWLDHLAARIRREIEAETPGRHVHLVLENERNGAGHLRAGPKAPGFDAQWNDDGHNVLHPLLTGEREAYYEDFADNGAEKLARVLAEGFLFQGETMPHLGHARGEPSAHLPPTAFVLFLQNHDQVGNRAFGERLPTLSRPAALKAATALLLLSPQIPLLFMGEEWAATAPFLFFTAFPQQDLADAVREGRRKEFAKFAAFQDPEKRERIPDPNAEKTFTDSIPDPAESEHGFHAEMLALHKALIALRHAEIIPRLPGARAIGADAVGPKAVLARWRLGDGTRLTIALNLDETPAAVTAGGTIVLHESIPDAAESLAAGSLPPDCAVVMLDLPENSGP